LLDGFALDVKVSYDTRWIFNQFSGLSRLVFRSSVRGKLQAAIMILDYESYDAYISLICITPMHVSFKWSGICSLVEVDICRAKYTSFTPGYFAGHACFSCTAVDSQYGIK